MTNKIILSSGKEIDVNWAGISTMDGYLRFGIPDIDFTQAMLLFSNPAETKRIDYNADGVITTWENYTKLIGLNQFVTNETIVTLAPAFPLGG